MCGDFGRVCERAHQLFERMQARDRRGFDAELERMIEMAQTMLGIGKPAKPPKTCEHCQYGKPSLLCSCDGGPHVNMRVGAANTCDRWKRKRR
jgi:hypothetical protein